MKLTEEQKREFFRQIKYTHGQQGGQQVSRVSNQVTAEIEELGIKVTCDTYRSQFGNRDLCLAAIGKLLSTLEEGLMR